MSAMHLHSPKSEYNAEPSPSMIVINPTRDLEGEEMLLVIEQDIKNAINFKQK